MDAEPFTDRHNPGADFHPFDDGFFDQPGLDFFWGLIGNQLSKFAQAGCFPLGQASIKRAKIELQGWLGLLEIQVQVGSGYQNLLPGILSLDGHIWRQHKDCL